MYYYREGIGTVKVWELSIAELMSSDWWNFRVDASSGQIIDKDNWTISCNILGDHEDHVHNNLNSISTSFIGPIEKDEAESNENSMLVGNYRVYAMPLESPNYGVRTLVANPEDLTASPFGWHDLNGIPGSETTDSRGNNVDAYEDGDNPGYRPDGGGGLVFDFLSIRFIQFGGFNLRCCYH
jgi:Fungalysin metallopeptidase (M36).